MTDAPAKPRSLRPMMLLGVAFITGTCVFAAVFALVRFFTQQPAEGLKPLAQRKPATLTMSTLDGKNWSLADQTGKIVIINYFATWCPPCLAEMPTLTDIANTRAPDGVVVAAVSLDADPSAAQSRVDVLKSFQRDQHLPFPILLPSLDSPLFATTFPLPQTILVDRHGRTARVILGQLDPTELRTNIDQLLKEP